MLFPLFTAILLIFIKKDFLRDWIVRLSAVILCGASIYLLITYFKGDATYFTFESALVENGILGLDILVGLLLVYLGIKYKKVLVLLLVVLQVGVTAWYELAHAHEVVIDHNLFIDKFSIIMALIIGIIGSLICVYALGYMKDFMHHHPEQKDRRNVFFFLLFIFLSAMFGIIFSNNMLWLYFFWEVTTLCSFLLIGFTKTKEAIKNSFRALVMNLLGGLGFVIGIIYMGLFMGTLELDKLISIGGLGTGIALIPAIFIGFAGLTKAAQLPFSSWLLGAMVAPTPTSALLHSSTMVKAGVYIIIRLAPLYGFNVAGIMVMMVGGITFMVASFVAISQSDAKKVLAYSTIANLGLIVACGGLGSYEAVWGGILLIIFHAIAKSLLFMCVGTVEHTIGSRNIEDMDGLFVRMPKVATMMVIGIAGMFLAPFGMLISKWAVLKAFIDSKNIFLVILLVFGSAATLFFWTKWMGKIIAIVDNQVPNEKNVHKDEWFTLLPIAILTIVVCFIFPLISHTLIEPYLDGVYGAGRIGLSEGNIKIMSMMLGMLVILPIGMLVVGSKHKIVPAYLAGANVGDNTKFYGTMGQTKDLSLRNFYMEKYFGEKKLMLAGVIVSSGLIAIVFSIIVAVIIGGLI